MNVQKDCLSFYQYVRDDYFHGFGSYEHGLGKYKNFRGRIQSIFPSPWELSEIDLITNQWKKPLIKTNRRPLPQPRNEMNFPIIPDVPISHLADNAESEYDSDLPELEEVDPRIGQPEPIDEANFLDDPEAVVPPFDAPVDEPFDEPPPFDEGELEPEAESETESEHESEHESGSDESAHGLEVPEVVPEPVIEEIPDDPNQLTGAFLAFFNRMNRRRAAANQQIYTEEELLEAQRQWSILDNIRRNFPRPPIGTAAWHRMPRDQRQIADRQRRNFLNTYLANLNNDERVARIQAVYLAFRIGFARQGAYSDQTSTQQTAIARYLNHEF